MKVELNIGLNITGRRNSFHETTQRARQALNVIKTAGLRYSAETVHSEYEGPNGIEIEPTLVVEIDSPAIGHTRVVKAIVYEIACQLEQDCVAIYYPNIKQGELIGPRAASWGAFNPEFFRTFAEVALPRAA